jgi:soluble lytic murein transglycosylase-like protein
VGSVAPLPFIRWLLPAVLAALVLISGLHAARVVGQPLRDRILRPATDLSTDASVQDSAGAAELGGFAPTVERWHRSIDFWAQQHNLPADLVATVMQIESCGDPAAVSPAGALGLFQVMPYHFHPGQNPLDPATNATVGLQYLARALELADGDSSLALAGYNGGHGAIRQPATEWPEETKRYVAWGSAILREAHAADQPTLAKWLRAGGERLCSQAASYSDPPMTAILDR